MFSLFKAIDQSGLQSGKEKVRRLVQQHLRTLVRKRHAGISRDSYGIIDSSRWNAEVQYFMDKVVLPELTQNERLAFIDAGLSLIGNELVEAPVRVECGRLHDSGQADMTIPTIDKINIHQENQSRLANSMRPSNKSANLLEPQRGLIIRAEPLEKILSGQKTWEMRSSHTKIRGPIGLIQKGSKAVHGVASIIDSRGPLNQSEMLSNIHCHKISADRLNSGEVANYNYAWILGNVRRLPKPIPYQHGGGVTFVTLDGYAIQQIRQFAHF